MGTPIRTIRAQTDARRLASLAAVAVAGWIVGVATSPFIDR
jgi:hypothetical protein